MNTRYYLRLLRTLVLAALTAAAAAACSDDNDENDGREPLTPPDGNGGIPVTFTANINPGSDADPAAAPGTRTVLKPDGRNGFTVEWKGTDNNPTSGYDRIYIWAVKGTDKIGFKTYVPATSDASSELEPKDDGNKLTLTETGEWKFTAVYGPYSIFNYEPLIILSHLEQSAPGKTDHIAGNDFSVATATQTVDAGDMPNIINFKFEHKLSALQLRVTNQTGEELTVKEIRLSVAGGEMTTTKYYDVAQGKWKTTGEEKADHLKLIAENFPALATGTESQDFHMLLFPEPAHSRTNMTVTVITSRGEYSRTRPAPDGGFLAAKNYLTNIVIKTDGLTAEEKWVETISNKAELIAFRDKVNGGNNYTGKTVRLTADIDLTGETWTPIGTFLNSFSGTFDGGGYHISKLNVDYGSKNYAGLFGWVESGTVRNLRVSGTVTTTGYHAGGIAGYLYGSTVENCIFDGDVSAGNTVGGIAGYSTESSRIAGCHTKGTVTATATASFSQNAGGIAGQNYNSTIDGCYSEAEVKAGYERAGGIAGTNENGTITYCYATGKVSGKKIVGGIVGYQSGGTLTGCIALNPGLTRTEGNYTDFGRVVGDNQGSSPVTSCGAYEGMTITDANGSFTGTGEAGTALTRGQCLTYLAYTSRDFPEATATPPGWAFSAATPWTYLPWNKVFEDFPGITDPAQYRIAVPAHLSSSGGTN